MTTSSALSPVPVEPGPVSGAGHPDPAARVPRTTPSARVLILAMLLLAIGVSVAVFLLPDRAALADPPPAALPLLAIGFAAAEWGGLRISVVDHVQTVALTELPYVLALLFLTPAETVLARVLATAIVVALRYRSTSVKTAFNVALWVSEAAVAAVVTSYAAGMNADPMTLRTWGAVAAGVLAGPALLSALATTAAMAIYEQRFSVRDLGAAVAQQLPLSLAVCLPSLVVGVALLTTPTAAALVLPSFAVMAVAYRSYSALYRSHRALRGLYTFTHKVSGSYEVDPVLRQVLVEARSLLGVPYAEILLDGGTVGTGLRATIAGDRLLTVPLRPEEPLPPALRAGRPALLHARGAEPRLAHWLAARDLSAIVAAPLPGDGGTIGLVLVGSAEGGVHTFTRGDVELLASLAEQASVAIRHADLLGQLRHSSDHDGLTGLANRSVLHREVERHLSRVAAGEQLSLAVLALDLDGFKDVNDGFGHAHGDAVLVEVARRLAATIPAGAVLARLGGDEFALVVADHSAEEALALAARIRTALEDAVQIGVDRVGVGASVGAAVAASTRAAQVLTTAALLQRADLAMYASKGSDHTPRLWEPALENRQSQRGPLLADLRRAIAEHAITVQVQPQVDARTGQLTSVEVLARWLHDELGEVPPSTFVPVAERGGLMAPLTELVLDGALTAVASWQTQGVTVPVAVNVSARDVDNLRLVHAVRRGLAEHRIAPALLTLELTETSVMADPERSAAIFRELKALGVRLSIDDFGTGWSSLAQLQQITVDELKVDRSFVQHLSTSTGDAAIVRSVLDLGRNLGMGVVAEGVEDAQTLEWLAAAGCDRVQGYYVSRPMPPDQLLVWARGRGIRPSGWLSLAG